MDCNVGIRRFRFSATSARTHHKLPVEGFGFLVLAAPAASSATLQFGDQDGETIPLIPGRKFRSAVPFGQLYLSNVAADAGTIDLVVLTDPDAELVHAAGGDLYAYSPGSGAWTPVSGSHELEVAESAARTGTQNFDFEVPNGAQLSLVLDVTSNPGSAATILLALAGRDTLSGQAITLVEGTADAMGGAAGRQVVVAGAADAAVTGSGNSASSILPWRLSRAIVTPSAGSWTYSVSAQISA